MSTDSVFGFIFYIYQLLTRLYYIASLSIFSSAPFGARSYVSLGDKIATVRHVTG